MYHLCFYLLLQHINGFNTLGNAFLYEYGERLEVGGQFCRIYKLGPA